MSKVCLLRLYRNPIQNPSQRDFLLPSPLLLHLKGLSPPPALFATNHTNLLAHSASSSLDLTPLGESRKLGIRSTSEPSVQLKPRYSSHQAYKSVYDAAVFCLEHGGRLAGKVENPLEASKHCATLRGKIPTVRCSLLHLFFFIPSSSSYSLRWIHMQSPIPDLFFPPAAQNSSTNSLSSMLNKAS